MHRREYILASGAVLGASSIGAVAFTSATVQRDVTIGIAADNNAVIGLTSGDPGITVDGTTGKLNIQPPSSADADGLNPDASFTYGDTSSATSLYAFSIDNNDSGPHNYTVDLNNYAVTMQVFDNTGSSVGTVNSTNGSVSTTGGVASGDSLYIVMTVDTPTLDTSSQLNDMLTISASTPTP